MWKQNLRQFGGQPENIPISTCSHELKAAVIKYSLGTGQRQGCQARKGTSDIRPNTYSRSVSTKKGTPKYELHMDKAEQRSFEALEESLQQAQLPLPHNSSLQALLSPEEDDIFDQDIEVYNTMARQCEDLERFATPTSTDPGIRPWRKSEEAALLEYVEKNNGASWKEVAAKFNRTAVGCMAKYHALKDST
ncbi:hypothetical protein BX667DRAFT_410016 [Coemansia mojavensis]|nr:hypothetical protein BX667DRAFT_410016 [Coemansia mojavensis]